MGPRSQTAAVLGLDECEEKLGSVWTPGSRRSNSGTAGSARCFFGAITHGHHSPLVFVPKRTERRHEKDRGGMDARHYIETVVRLVLGPWWKTLPGEGKDHVLVDGGSPAHRAGETEEVFSELGIQQVL
jgi:hypothetical protein